MLKGSSGGVAWSEEGSRQSLIWCTVNKKNWFEISSVYLFHSSRGEEIEMKGEEKRNEERKDGEVSSDKSREERKGGDEENTVKE